MCIKDLVRILWKSQFFNQFPVCPLIVPRHCHHLLLHHTGHFYSPIGKFKILSLSFPFLSFSFPFLSFSFPFSFFPQLFKTCNLFFKFIFFLSFLFIILGSIIFISPQCFLIIFWPFTKFRG